MQPRRIDGIYAREPVRRPTVERRILVPARSNDILVSQPPRPVVIADVTPPELPTPQLPSPPAQPLEAQPARPISAPELVAPPAPPAKATKKRRIATAAYSAVIVGVLILTGVLGYSTWITNERARAEFSKDTGLQQAVGSGQIAGSAPPSEASISDQTKQAYTVAADMPRMLHIDRIDVHARVLRMSVTNKGEIQAPGGIWDTGWYDGSAKPGEPGTTFIDGHVSGPTMDAVFVKLKVLHPGDYVTVERGDGSKITYIVKTVSTNKLGDIDMKKILAAPSGEKQQLVLMTCGGNYQGNYKYDSRVIVAAERVS